MSLDIPFNRTCAMAMLQQLFAGTSTITRKQSMFAPKGENATSGS